MSDRAITLRTRKRTFVLLVLTLFLTVALSIGRASAADANLLDTLRAQGNLTQLVAAIEANGLESTVNGDTFTVLAPTDQAFAALSGANVSVDTLQYHLLSGNVSAETIRQQTSIQAVNGQSISVSQLSGLILLNDIASIMTRDIAASNGTVHIIDTVLFPRGGGAQPPASAPAGGGAATDSDECVIPASGPWPPCATGGATPPATGGDDSGECVIPASGPWPPCATGGGGVTTPPATGGDDSGECVIPASGPWPPCATGGGGGVTTPPATGGDDSGECVIPASGPWPPCATGGGGGGTTPPPADDGGNGGDFTPVSGGTTTVNVTNGVALSGATRLGINVGGPNQFGARQLLDNIIPNPGFESAEFAMTFIVFDNNPTANRIQADYWETRFNNDQLKIGQPLGFWDGASFEVLSGPAVGRSGTITSFTFDEGRYTFNLSGGGAVPAVGSAVVVRKEIGGYDFDTITTAKAAPGQTRPGSPGAQSLRLTPSGNTASYTEFFDSYGRDIDTTAGKLLLVNGQWNFNMWAKAAGSSGTLRVRFARINGSTFLDKTYDLGSGWTNIIESFEGTDAPINGVPGPLALQMFVSGGDVMIDDASLKRASYGGNEFSDTFVQDLRELKPGTIRNWGGQLGSTLDNQLATEFARQPTGYSPRARVADQYHYSIHSFLQLAQQVGANPWIVIPPSWTSAELQNFMAYLGAANGAHPYATRRAQLGQTQPWTNIFGQIHIEYGNEIWGGADNNDPYIGATFRGGVRAGQISNNRFNIMKASPYYNASKFNMIIGGQSRFAGRQQEIEDNSQAHDSIGFAPYYGTLENFGGNGDRYNPLYAHAVELSQRGFMVDNQTILRNTGQGTQMALYEVNLDFVKEFVPGDICNDFLTSLGSGISLPLVMLAYQRDMGIRHQAAFQAAQYSNAFRRCGGEPQRLFGLLRDVEATDRKRPAFLAVEMANIAVGGNMLVTNISGPAFTQQPGNGVVAATQTPYVQAFAFQNGGQYSVVLFNVDINASRQVQLNVPSAGSSATMYSLSGNINADNETSQQVSIQTSTVSNFSQSYSMTMQPNSMVVLTWR